MAHTRVTLSLPPELAERWTKVVEKHSLVKSVMLQNYLKEVIPYLEKRDAKSIINFRIEDNSRSLFEDDSEYVYTDKDWEEQYKELQERKLG